MNSRSLIFVMMSLVAVMSGCKDTEIDVNSGNGSMTYDGTSYTLNRLTLSTSASDSLYDHSAILTGKENKSAVFSFSIKDANSANKLSAGNYTIARSGNYTAHFATGDAGDVLSGILRVTISDGKYSFTFDGTTVDENTPTKRVAMMYVGKVME